MNKLTMVGIVVIVAGVIFIGSYGAAAAFLLASPAAATVATTTQTTPSTATTSATSSVSPTTQSTSSASVSTTALVYSISIHISDFDCSPFLFNHNRQLYILYLQIIIDRGRRPSFAVTLVLTGTGWNGSAALKFHIPLGASVTLTIIYQDPNGDQHPLFVTGAGLNVNGPTMSAGRSQGHHPVRSITGGNRHHHMSEFGLHHTQPDRRNYGS